MHSRRLGEWRICPYLRNADTKEKECLA